ncbi:hypothetical protein GCM10027563_00480 [Parasphingorhabdus pacifica]
MDQLAAYAAMFRANALFNRRIDEVLRSEAGVSLAEHELLAVLDGHGGSARMGDLARDLMFSKSGVTRLVGKLEDQHGWVARVLSPTDRRAAWAELTPDGRAVLNVAEAVFERAVADLFDEHLDPSELRRIADDLEHVIAANDWEPAAGSCAAELAPKPRDQ